MSTSIWIEWQQECDRCELLGLPTPPRPKTPEPGTENENSDDNQEQGDEQDGARGYSQTDQSTVEEELSVNSEQLNNATGGLDQLNSILGVTQRKLNRFKLICGSLTKLNLLRLRERDDDEILSRGNSSDSVDSTAFASNLKNDFSRTSTSADANLEKSKTVANDIEQNVSSQIGKLDLMLKKADQAEISMSSQRKQMKSYLAK